MTHLAYHPIENALYALHRREPDEYNPNGPWFQSEMRLIRKPLPEGAWEFVSGNVISMDGIQSGQCDLDPFNNRYFFVQDGKIRVVDCITCDLLYTIYDNGPDVISQWANLQYHDLSVPVPTGARIEVHDTLFVLWKGSSPLPFPHGMGDMLIGEWNSNAVGAIQPNGSLWIENLGLAEWTGSRFGMNGETLEIRKHDEVIAAENSGIFFEFNSAQDQPFPIWPSPIAA